jgi:NAD(P)H-nitrite reductase large subunit
MNYVIIGNSASGVAAAQAIRECDKKNRITVISDEPHSNYSRPLISYLLGKKVVLDKMVYRGKDFYRDNKVELFLNKKAAKLDPEKKWVILSDGQKIWFDKLLIATGGTPTVPEVKGSNLNGVFTFTKLSDAQKIETYIKANKVKEAIVIGGGLIGLKATEALIELKIKVTIVELANRILSSTFDQKASGLIERGLEKIGCRLLTNNRVVEIKSKNRKVNEVILKDRKKVPASLAIMAIGVRPNIKLVKNTSIKTNKGILVDNFMQTSVKDIYAAGDCCEAKDLLLNINRPIAIWPVAVKQGKIAGYNMAGVKKEYPGGFAMNSVELCGIPTISVGETCPGEKGYQVLEHFDEEKSVYKKIVLKNSRIVGAIFVGDIERAGIYTGLIKDKVDTTSFKEHLLRKEFGLISLPKEYRKHLVTGEGIEV